MYFTVFTGIESVPPGMSDLGVIISIELSYTMWCEGRKGPEEVSSPDMHEGMLHGDVAWFLMRAYNSMKSMVTGCLPHCLILREQPELLINLLFPMICVNTCALGESLPVLRRCRKASREDTPKPSANPTTKGTDKGEMMLYLQAQSNWCWEMWCGQRLMCVSRKKEDGISMGRSRIRNSMPGCKWFALVWDERFEG